MFSDVCGRVAEPRVGRIQERPEKHLVQSIAGDRRVLALDTTLETTKQNTIRRPAFGDERRNPCACRARHVGGMEAPGVIAAEAPSLLDQRQAALRLMRPQRERKQGALEAPTHDHVVVRIRHAAHQIKDQPHGPLRSRSVASHRHVSGLHPATQHERFFGEYKAHGAAIHSARGDLERGGMVPQKPGWIEPRVVDGSSDSKSPDPGARRARPSGRARRPSRTLRRRYALLRFSNR